MKKVFFTIALGFLSIVIASGQLADETIAKLDKIFLEWNEPGHPGGTIGIMKNGEMVYCKSFGLASLEFLVPNANSTRYNIASVSKQFTAYAILLLEKQGKLSTTDDVHKYIPELPDFGHEITLEHMIHHTSGMRSLHSMLQLAGWRSDDSRFNKDLMRFMLRQKELNFKPGEEYLYCNTGYIMLSEIIERISGQDFALWMKENVFFPMGMYDTYVEDQYNRVVTENATSYSGNGSRGFVRSIDYWGYVGSGNIHSTAADILTWNINFYKPKKDLEEVFRKMENREVLNKGDTISYAFGVNVDSYKGNKRIHHGGSIGGYRSFAVTFPEDNISIAILTNFSSSSPGGRANSVADLVLSELILAKPDSETQPGGRPEQNKTYNPGKEELEALVGEYFSPELMTSYFFYFEDQKLRAYHNRHGYIDLTVTAENQLEGSAGYFRDIEVIRNDNGEVDGIRVSNGRVRNLWFEKK